MPLCQHVMVGQAAARPVRRLRRRRRAPASSRRARRSTTSSTRIARDDWASSAADARPPLAAQGQARVVEEPARGRQRPPGLDPEPGRRRSTGSTREGLLPAIVFIFSRAGCDAAVSQCLQRRAPAHHAGRARRDLRVRRGARAAHLPDEDLARPGLPRVPRRPDPRHRRPPRRHAAGVQGGRRGAVRRAGWSRSSSRPRPSRWASTCPRAPWCIEKLVKWNGETHADITPGEYTQLTGRAGRRGIDVEGHAVVLWQPGMDPRERGRPGLHPHLPAALALPAVVQHGGQPRAPVRPRRARASCSSRRSPSSRPTGPWSGWPGSCARARTPSTGYREAATCHLGDFMEYAGLRRRISDAGEGRPRSAPGGPARRGRRRRCGGSSPAT